MSRDEWIDAITELDSDILDRYFKVKNEMMSKARKKRIMRWSSVAACLMICVCVVQIINLTGKNSAIGPTKPGASNGTSSESQQSVRSLSFQTYKEMLSAFLHEDSSYEDNMIRYYKRILGDTYARFVERIESKRSIPLPMQNGEPMAYRNKEGFSNITFFPREWCDMPWIWYFCSVGDETVTVKISYPDCLKNDIDYSKNCSEILKEINPNAVNVDNYKHYPNYKNVYLKNVRIASGEISALIYEYKDTDRVMIVYCYDGVMVSLEGKTNVLNEEFLQSFSMLVN